MVPVESDPSSFVIISRVGAQDHSAETTDTSSKGPTDLPKPLQTFISGEPEVLGVIQIFTGIIHIALGIVLTMSLRSYFDVVRESGLPLWTGIMYIISGALSVAASNNPTVGKVRSSMAVNIVCCVFAGVAVIIYCIATPMLEHILGRGIVLYCVCYEENLCEGSFHPQTVVIGIVSILFILTVLELCVCLSNSIFGCRVLCRTSFNEMTVVIYQSATLTTDHSSSAPAAMKPSQNDDDAEA
ncbi:membrane-spanning 4-domains subfamily A member 4A [Xenopus laevis]|uniref:Membrane-spanning 4-domains subfamily A member 4A-like n=2 Tax=Xenopus laevis TaxID=8355 RepID=A0A974HCS3_XENLA|nr:membrane-spanning 4-domains subfamily A member 4A [Xenopus laevis]OCT72736.1 hypothetical protein XELAEV_18035719mg [Xenopus laevis]